MAEARAGLPMIREQADCVELRLDLFEEAFDLPLLLRERGHLPAVVTLRPPDQGGHSRLPASERLRVLVRAAELGAEYVDVEWNACTPQFVGAARAAGARVIVSRHDFSSMPALFAGWYPELLGLRPDVVKVVGTAVDVRDCLEVFRVFGAAERPTIAIAMGEAGLSTRVLAMRSERCLLTYAALDRGSGTAPGQLTAAEMRQTYRVGRLGPATRVYGLLGPHLERERLGEYNAWFAADALDAVAVPFVSDLAAAADEIVSAFRELPVSGWHIHGEALQRSVLAVLDELGPEAARQHKANSILHRADESLVGHWVESPKEQYDLWRSVA